MGITEHRWEKYIELRNQIIGIEESLAEEFFSRKQMYEWRINGDKTDPVLPLVKVEIVNILKGNPIRMKNMMD